MNKYSVTLTMEVATNGDAEMAKRVFSQTVVNSRAYPLKGLIAKKA